MRKLHILKSLIDLFYFFAIIALGGMLIMIPILLFDTEGGIPIKIKGQEISNIDLGAKVLMLFAAVGAVCFVYAIHLLRKTIGHFYAREIFHPKVIFNLNRTGIFIIASSLLTNIPLFFYNVISRQHLGIEFGAGGFDSLILSVSLGLFFMVLSEVFKIAMRMKEENELTV